MASIQLDVKTPDLGELVKLKNKTEDYAALLKLIKTAQDAPDITIRFQDLTVERQVPVRDQGIPNLCKHFADFLTCASCRRATKGFKLISNLNGVLKPGTMTLVLTPPGHGKSALLKALAGQTEFSGNVWYNGQTRSEAEGAGLKISKACAYVDQVDCHMPLLTVRETFQFAVDQANADPAKYGNEQLRIVHKNKVDIMLRLLGLEECAETILGNELIRGVSGGQKKRVTIGEAMLTDARALFLDEITSGLDAKTAADILHSLRQWATISNGIVVSALLQPTPEIFEMFDNLILLREGICVYNGPRKDVMKYFEERGIFCPADTDQGDFLTEFISHPRAVYERQVALGVSSSSSELSPTPSGGYGATPKPVSGGTPQPVSSGPPPTAAETLGISLPEEKKAPISVVPTPAATLSGTNGLPTTAEPEVVVFHFSGDQQNGAASLSNGNGTSHINVSPKQGQVAPSAVTDKGVPIPLTTAELENSYRNSPFSQAIERELATPVAYKGTELKSDYARLQYTREYTHSFIQHTAVCVKRQRVLNGRNKGLIGPRIGQSVIFGLIMGSLFYQVPNEAYILRIGLLLFGTLFLAFANMVELPIVIETKRVAYKQAGYHWFPVSSYVLSVVLMHIPLAVAETVILGSFIYWMSGFFAAAEQYFIFLGLLLSSNLALSVWFRTLGFLAPTIEIGQAMAGPSTGMFMLFGGFLITQSKIPPWFIWVYWISPFAWVLRSLALNEFHSDRYSAIVPGTDKTIGDVYLDQWEFSTEQDFQWAGAVYLGMFFLLLATASALVLKYKRDPLSIGTKRGEAETEDHYQVEKKSSSKLPFEPVTLSFKNVKFTVKVQKLSDPDGGGKRKKIMADKPLLRGVSGFAQPGTLTALMGATGAGKTTLLDVLAGRKTQGVIEGEILVNGQPKNKDTFARISGYVEQSDNHMAWSTVYESLMFSARLRLPGTVSEADCKVFVDEVMDLLELTEIKDRLIGNSDYPGLSPGQLKRVTIGVELVANPAVLFLDEPTTGLDSRAALTVMRVVRRIATTGRSVICTIHQPSAELFFMFDRLLLLQSGGYEVFFGNLGFRARELVKYFVGLGCPAKPPRLNPASWMLAVTGGDVEASDNFPAAPRASMRTSLSDFSNLGEPDWCKKYHQSTLYNTAMANLAEASKPVEVKKPQPTPGWGVQFSEVFYRGAVSFWRNVPFMWTRMFVLTFLGLIYGLLYFQIGTENIAGISSKVAVVQTVAGFGGVISTATFMPVIMKDRAVFYRERTSGTYGAISYALTTFLIDLPYVFLAIVLFATPFYFLVGFENDATLFFKFILAGYLNAVAFCTVGHLMTGVMPNLIVAGIAQGMFFSITFLFGGLVIPGPEVPAGWRWLYSGNPLRHALEAMTMPQFNCDAYNDITACPSVPVFTGTQFVQMTKAKYVKEYYGFGYNDFWNHIGYLILFIGVGRLLAFRAIQKINHVKR